MNYEKLCQEAIEVVTDAAAFIRKEFEGFDRNVVEEKALNQLVSYVDVTAEKILVNGLDQLLDDCGFITEENTIAQTEGHKYRWVIDPLDGTTNFIHGLPVFSVSVGLLEKDKLVLGIVYEVTKNECFYAWKGSPAYLNGKEIKVSGAKKLQDSLLATGFPYYEFEGMDGYLNCLRHYMKNTRGLRRMGSAAIDLVYTAAGRFEGFFELSLQPWDVAAGAFIVQQAGGKVVDFAGGSDFLFSKQIVACCPGIYKEFFGVIKENMKQ
jgi:myo-inositol-1(or 4)-monophosphatase